ncbi:MAG TPA: hypothetical protein VEC36_00680, partial [Patescibacteria group bacterium]|nr:hypothetical protein [Patescibacteria group bacterium]
YKNQHIGSLRNSRIAKTRKFILSNTKSSLLNNTKWLKIFEELEKNKNVFWLKNLLTENVQKCQFIRELEITSVLIDESGDFIEFLEIESLILQESSEMEDFLIRHNVPFLIQNSMIEINGYTF